jgi:hypothetical protein
MPGPTEQQKKKLPPGLLEYMKKRGQKGPKAPKKDKKKMK